MSLLDIVYEEGLVKIINNMKKCSCCNSNLSDDNILIENEGEYDFIFCKNCSNSNLLDIVYDDEDIVEISIKNQDDIIYKYIMDERWVNIKDGFCNCMGEECCENETIFRLEDEGFICDFCDDILCNDNEFEIVNGEKKCDSCLEN